MEALLEETAVDSVPLTKPKKVVSQKQLDSMKAGREILKQKRELVFQMLLGSPDSCA